MNPTHLIIFNRAAAAIEADWIHIVPKGELPNREAGVVQVLDDVALDRILANIAADQARLGDRWPGIYAGREHFIYNSNQDSAALAWFKEFKRQGNGIWAKADGLTPAGKAALANKEYKFTSFVADRRDTEDLGNGRLRVLKLDTVGFTNHANGKELLTPIVNRENFPGAAAPGANQPTNTNRMKNIAQKLGLAPEASEDAILAEVAKIQNRVAALEPLAAENTTLKNRNTQLETEQVAALLDAHGVTEEAKRGKLAPVLGTLKNREERVSFLTELGFKVAAEKADGQQQLLNRAGAATPANKGGKTPTDQDLAQKAEAEINTYRLQNRCSYSEARNAVRTAKPELFGLAR